jgi:hypothetical protein
MNPQPEPIVGQIGAILFIVAVIFSAIKSYFENDGIDIKTLDNFVIGHLEDSQVEKTVELQPIIHHHNNTTVKKYTKPTKVIERVKVKRVVETKPDLESQQLYADCIEALVALGMKKREAKNKALFVFSTTHPQPKTIQEFLMIALKAP